MTKDKQSRYVDLINVSGFAADTFLGMCPKRPPQSDPTANDPGLEYLLSLDGEVLSPGQSGFWIKIEAFRVDPSAGRPRGIKYSLTLHDASGKRVIGFDNAHGGVQPAGSPYKYAGTRLPFDHRQRHEIDPGVYYEYTNGFKLLEDFYGEVRRVLEELQP